MISDAQSITNIQEDSLVGNFVYNHENQRKILIKGIVKEELSFNLCKSFNFEEYVQLVL